MNILAGHCPFLHQDMVQGKVRESVMGGAQIPHQL